MVDNSSFLVGSRNGVWGSGDGQRLVGWQAGGACGAQKSIYSPTSMELFQYIYTWTVIQVCPSCVAPCVCTVLCYNLDKTTLFFIGKFYDVKTQSLAK